MDVSHLATMSRGLGEPPDQQVLDQIRREALDLQQQIDRRLETNASQIEAAEKIISERWGSDAKSFQSSEFHAAVASATSQADSQADLWVQRAALQGMIDACRKNDVSDFIQFLGFAQQPRKTMRQLPERMNHQKTGIPTWPIWAGIVVAALVGQFLKRR